MRPNRLFKTLCGAALLLILAGCGGGSSTSGAAGGGGDGGGGDAGGGDGGGSVTTSVTLDWDATTTRADGSALTVAGYRVSYGTAPGSYGTTVDIGDATTCVIEGLTTGNTYFFVVTSYDSSGNESEPSNEISKDI